jgi:serine/threonine protein phosphatase PrpC
MGTTFPDTTFVLESEHSLAERGPNLKKCFGDFENRCWHSAEPEINSREFVPGSGLLLTSDGAFDGLEPENIMITASYYGSLVRNNSQDPSDIIVKHALDELNSKDNITAATCFHL